MDGRTSPHVPSYDGLIARIQEALVAIGEVEKTLGAFETETLRNHLRNDLNTAVAALQRARDRVGEEIGR